MRKAHFTDFLRWTQAISAPIRERGVKEQAATSFVYASDTDLEEITGHKVALDQCRQLPAQRERTMQG